MSESAKVSLVCALCEAPFSLYRSTIKERETRGLKRFFCSRKCYANSLTLSLPETLSAEYQAGASTIALARKYGVSGETVVHRLRSQGAVLRPKGWDPNRNPTKGRGHTAATKEKLRVAHQRQFEDPVARARASSTQTRLMSEGRIKRTSKLEDRVAQHLDELGVQYQRWVGLRAKDGRFVACVDFLLCDGRVLEVHGDFWHANPRLYPTGPAHASQRKSVANDARKNEALSKLGYVLRHVWEFDVKAFGAAAVRSALWNS